MVNDREEQTEVGEVQDRTKEVIMRRVIVSTYVSLDGVIEDTSWTFLFFNEEAAKYAHD